MSEITLPTTTQYDIEVLPGNSKLQLVETSPRVFVRPGSGGTTTGVTPGTVFWYAGDTPPAWALECDGSEYDEDIYAQLFNIVGTTFNTGGETSGYFRVPNISGGSGVNRFIRGADGTTFSVGDTGVDGAPDIDASFSARETSGTTNIFNDTGSGALSFSAGAGGSVGTVSIGTGENMDVYSFAASADDSATYSDSNTEVTPQYIALLPCIAFTEFYAEDSGVVAGDSSFLSNAGLSVSAGSGALTINLTTAAGGTPAPIDPVRVPFKQADGTVDQVFFTGATSIVVPSGATLGLTAAEAFRVWVLAFENGELGVFQSFEGSDTVGDVDAVHPLCPWAVAPTSAAAIGTGSDSAGVIYANSDQSGNAFAVVGFIEWDGSGLSAAGTWTTTNHLRTQIYGPGVPLPGSIVQSTEAYDGSVDTTTSATYVSTTHTHSIALTSAANIVSALFGGSAQGSAGQSAEFQLSRGTTANTNIFGNTGLAGISGLAIIGTASATSFGMDKPNTTSSTTYAMQYQIGGGATATYRYSLSRLSEVMT